jgi:acetylglutamate kinase
VDGLRVTDAATLDVVTAVLRGLLNARLVATFGAAGRRAIGISGVDGGLLSASQDHRLGFVGHVTGVDVALLDRLCADGLLPIVAPIAADPQGQLLNVNADEAAGAVAAARGGRLLLLTDVAGVERDGRLIPTLDAEGAQQMLADGSADGGMRPKLRAAITAAEAGCEVRILDGRSATSVRAALAGAAVGTQVMKTAGVAPVAGGQS